MICSKKGNKKIAEHNTVKHPAKIKYRILFGSFIKYFTKISSVTVTIIDNNKVESKCVNINKLYPIVKIYHFLQSPLITSYNP